MQTFLPYPCYKESVKCLDNKRLGKQRVEALQILKAIYVPDYGWRHHPCVKMWKDYPQELMLYMNVCIDEWVIRGFNNTMSKSKLYSKDKPHWLGNEQLHNSHKSNLLRKDAEYYGKYNWKVTNDIEYYWCGYSKKEKEKHEENSNKENSSEENSTSIKN